MNPDKVVESLKRYEREEFKCKFLTETIEYFKNRKNKIIKINDDPKLLAGLRLHLLYQNHFVYLSDTLHSENHCHREINLSQKAANNLVNQIYGIENKTFIICEKIKSQNTRFYLIISEEPLNYLSQIGSEIWQILLGIHSLYFLEHQNLMNYCSENNLKNSVQLYQTLTNVKDKIYKLSWQERDKVLILS